MFAESYCQVADFSSSNVYASLSNNV